MTPKHKHQWGQVAVVGMVVSAVAAVGCVASAGESWSAGSGWLAAAAGFVQAGLLAAILYVLVQRE